MSKKYYESYVIIDGNLDDNAVQETISKFTNLLKKNEIDILNVNNIGRRRMAYPIRKRQNGFYVCFEIMCNPGVIAKIERAYQLDENLLRYLSIQVSDRTKKEKEVHFKNKALQEEAKLAELQASQAKEEATAEVPEKVEN
ncbi:MAG: 30S ribosomal protein S6 [Ignavibacteria bacterium]|nr:30S ribosomal protein S6 [Ignavibacteria bacterium]